VSDTAGVYTIPLLQPGTYTVSASANGFKNYVRANIALNTGDRTGIDIQMEVGEVAEQRADSTWASCGTTAWSLHIAFALVRI